MEMVLQNGFTELAAEEVFDVDGGAWPVLFTIWGIKVTVGHCLAAGATVGLTAGGALILK